MQQLPLPIVIIMTPTSQTNFDPNQVEPEELEDIFATTDGSDDFSLNTPPSQVLTPEQSYTATEAEQPVEETTTPTQDTYVLPADDAVASPKKISRINWRLIIILAIIVAGLCILAGVGFGVYYWYNQNNTNTVDDVVNANAVINISNDNVNLVNDNTNKIEIDNTNDNDVTNSNVNAGTFIDSDHDGLSDEEELIHNTNPKKKDTDEDGLTDREEVRVYLTDPRNTDTDGDSYMDGVEVSNFYHPNHPDPTKRLFDLE